jgi:hypothetical protein
MDDDGDWGTKKKERERIRTFINVRWAKPFVTNAFDGHCVWEEHVTAGRKGSSVEGFARLGAG